MTSLVSSMLNETHKGLIILWDYKFSLVMQMAGIFMVLLGIMFFVGQGNITPEQAASSILGFIVTFYALETLSNMSYALTNEAQSGTLEQMYMSPAPSQVIILGRSLSALVSATIQITLITGVMLLIFGVRLTFSVDALLVLLVTIIGLLGLGYLIGGLTIIFKQVGPLANIFQNFILIANGTFLPVEFMPEWMAAIVKLIPSTLGIISLRRVVLDGDTIGTLLADGSLFILIGHSVAFFFVGWVIYAVCERIARGQGSLGQY